MEVLSHKEQERQEVEELKVKNVKRKTVESLCDALSFVVGRKQFHSFTLYTLNFTL